MERIERIERRGDVAPVRLALLSPAERERERQDRQRRRRARPGSSTREDPSAGPTAAPGPAETAPRLDLRA